MIIDVIGSSSQLTEHIWFAPCYEKALGVADDKR